MKLTEDEALIVQAEFHNPSALRLDMTELAICFAIAHSIDAPSHQFIEIVRQKRSAINQLLGNG
jgi:hypothetical protein